MIWPVVSVPPLMVYAPVELAALPRTNEAATVLEPPVWFKAPMP